MKLRTWTSKNGKFTVEAEFVSYERGTVTIRKTNQTILEIPLSKLGKDDRKFVQEEVKQIREADKKKAAGSKQ